MNYPRTPDAVPLASSAGDMQALITTLHAHGKPHKNPDADGRHYVLAPADYEVHDLPRATRPDRATSCAKLRDAASFVAYVNDHKVSRTRVYATLDPARFLAVVDDHFPATEVGADEAAEQADWRGFRAEFAVPASREWELWNNANRKRMGQLSFAEFLQDNLPDVAKPEGAALLEMALNFEAAQTGTFVAAQRLQDGSHNLTWKADNNASGSVKLPELIELRIPVFENEEPRELTARLRYRVDGGSLSIWFELIRPHKVLEAAFRECWQRIADQTEVPILLGSPE